MVKQIYIEAPPKIVFDFLTRPERIARWLGMLANLEIPRVKDRQGNTRRRIAIRRGRVEKKGDSRAVFRWEVRGLGEVVESVVEISLQQRGSGTWLRLTHQERRIKVVGRRAKRGIVK